MQAIITAGGVPHPEEPLYEYTQGKPKALVDVAGKPMAQWVLDALCDSPAIEEIVLIGLTEESGVQCDKISAYLPSQGGILENIRAGVEKVVEQHPGRAAYWWPPRISRRSRRRPSIGWSVRPCRATTTFIIPWFPAK